MPDHFDMERVFSVRSEADFDDAALALFRRQSEHNGVYAEYLKLLGFRNREVGTAGDIPFLPIDFFRTHRVVTGEQPAERLFVSSGTTGAPNAVHHVADLSLYRRSFLQGFRLFYGDPAAWRILALIPPSSERPQSSLACMAAGLIEASRHPEGGFYMGRTEELAALLAASAGHNARTMLIGLSYALLDFAEAYPVKLRDTVVAETGGMKGRREELVREELHGRLRRAFGLDAVDSEYGMTELLSQAWSQGGGRYRCPPWMKVFIRETDDPFAPCPAGKTGMLCIADLANVHSCCFIATGDLGRCHDDGSFEVPGRFDLAGVRGCNLMAGEGI